MVSSHSPPPPPPISSGALMPSPLRFLSARRLPILALLALLALALALPWLPAAESVQAQAVSVTVFEQMLIVDTDKAGSFYGCGNVKGLRGCKSKNALSKGTFILSGTRYRVDGLAYVPSDDNLLLALDGLTGAQTKSALTGHDAACDPQRNGRRHAFVRGRGRDCGIERFRNLLAKCGPELAARQGSVRQVNPPDPADHGDAGAGGGVETALVGDAHGGHVLRVSRL